MKPKFYPGMDCQTADGRKVEIYKVTDEWIHACIDGEEYPQKWYTTGFMYPPYRSKKDLIPAPRKVTLQECWLLSYSSGKSAGTCYSEDAARINKPKGGFIRHIPAEERDVG